MSDPKDADLGSGIADQGKQTILRRTNNVNRQIEKTVRGNASKANRENVVGPKGTTTRSARQSEYRGSEGERAYGAPTSTPEPRDPKK